MTNETKQTAVEWLYLELAKFQRFESKYKHPREIYNKAKEMEKEQLIDARNDMQKKAIMLSSSIVQGIFIFDDKEAQKYYEQIYGGNNEQQ